MTKKLLVVCGPTATGKTGLGIKLAKKFAGEIVSVDSRQVYQGMNIGTGKDIGRAKFQVSDFGLKAGNYRLGYYQIRGIKVWLLDAAKPNQTFSVAHYVKLAQKVIKDIWQRGKLPIIVGGTGFYIKGLVDGIGTLGVVPDWELRWRLENLSVGRLFDMLARLNPDKAAIMNASDRKNSRRLIRAIEVAMKVKGGQTKRKTGKLKIDNLLFVGLRAPYKFLYQKIDQRVKKRVRQGIKREIKRLINSGYSWQSSALGTTLGYQQWRSFFEGKASQEEVIKSWSAAEHGYARRQMTWFRRDTRIHWFDITEKQWQDEVERLVKNWYHEGDASKG